MKAKTARKSSLGWLIGILLLAVLIRLVYLIEFSRLPIWTYLTVDNNYHINWAANIAAGNLIGDTTYFRAPLYVLALAAIIKLASVSLWAFRIFGLLIGVASTYLVYRIAQHLSGLRAARVAGLLFALCPIVIYFEAEILLDSFFTFLLLLSLLLTLRAAEQKAAGRLFSAGIVWGLAAITRPTVLVLLPVAVWIVLREYKPQFRTPARRVLLLLLGCVLIVSLTFFRNLYVADDPVLIASQGGVNLYIGNNGEADGITARLEEPLGQNWRISDITYMAEQEMGHKLRPGEVSGYWTARAIWWMLEHPGDAAKLYGKKLAYFFTNREVSNNRDLDAHFYEFVYLWYNPLTFGLFFVLAAMALVAERVGKRKMHLLGASVLLYALAVALFFISSRFRLPVVPLLIIMGASIFSLSWSDIKRKIVWVALAAIAASTVTFVKLVEFPPGSPVMESISRGLNRYSEGDFRQALQMFMAGRRVDSTFPEINLNCGAAYLRLGQSDSARFYFEMETQLNPKRHAAYTNLASLDLLSGNYREAQMNLNLALELKSYDIDANILSIRLAAADSSTYREGKMRNPSKAVERANRDIEVLLEAGNALSAGGNHLSAEPYLYEAAHSQPPPIETDDFAFDRSFRNSAENRKKLRARAYYQLGFCLSQHGSFKEAVADTEEAIRLDSTLLEAHLNLIAGYLTLGRTREADSVLSVAQERFGDNQRLKRFDRLTE